MSDAQKPPKNEYASTYFVQDRQNKQEMERVTIQDHMLTAKMGGVLPEQPDPSRFHRILDIGCGTGGWIIETAQAYPTMLLAGIDISPRMIEYACQQAATRQVADRTEFHVMDALLILEFPPDYFDLVNLRLGSSFLRTWEWQKMLSEMQRVSHPGSIVRVTDIECVHQSNSPALNQLCNMLICAFHRAGHYFAQTPDGITSHLATTLTRYGCQQVQTRAYPMQFHAGTPDGQAFCDDMAHAFHNFRPFIERRGCDTQDYDAIYQQALEEMRQPDFYAIWNLLSAWGTVP